MNKFIRKPEYKKVARVMPHCPVCKQELLGNNSVVSPFRCACGEWRYIAFGQGAGDYMVIQK